MSDEAKVVLEARGLSKSFPGVKALEDVSLKLRAGKLTAVLGENGAGKSTLMNILAGVFPADSGEILIDGNAVVFSNTGDSQKCGIAMIYQELNLVPQLTVAENIFLGREPLSRFGFVDFAKMNAEAEALLKQLELAVLPTAVTGSLRVGSQQMVEIAKALAGEARVLIMDEPTSAITEHEIEVLFRVIADLKKKGVAIAYITHKLDELTRIGDDAIVMRDGKRVGEGALKNLNRDEIIRLMVGRDLKDAYHRTPGKAGRELMRVEHVSLEHPDRPGDFLVEDVGFQLATGEVLGVYGLMGAGRTELLEVLFGLHPHSSNGEIYLDGKRCPIYSPVDAIEAGLALAPEDRKREGIVLEMSVVANASLASLPRWEWWGMIDHAAECADMQKSVERFRVKTPSLQQTIRNLSGGNQQKVILAKWLANNPLVLLLDEPTRGIDVNAKKEIYTLIDELTRAGLAVVMVSSELPEILAVSDRIMVLAGGRKTAEFTRSEANEENVMKAALPG